VATYSYYESLPENMRGLLPSPDEIAALLGVIEDDGADMEDKEI
jgi:hypothetical protein